MAQQEKKQPVGRVHAVIDNPDPNGKADWIELGPVWENRDGSLSFEIKATPIAWQNPRVRRQMQVRLTRAFNFDPEAKGGGGGYSEDDFDGDGGFAGGY